MRINTFSGTVTSQLTKRKENKADRKQVVLRGQKWGSHRGRLDFENGRSAMRNAEY